MTMRLAVLRDGLAALPESFITPPKDLRTLASWLHLADGLPAHAESGVAACIGHATATGRSSMKFMWPRSP